MIPVDHGPVVAFGAYCRLANGSPPDVLRRRVEQWVRKSIGPPLGELIRAGLGELKVVSAVRGGDTPEPPSHMISHKEYSDEDRARLAKATHLVWIRSASSTATRRAGLWAALIAAQLAADDFEGIVVDAMASRLVPAGERSRPPDDGRILISQHIRIWSSVGESGLMWMTTTGMPKFGLPNLEIVGLAPLEARIAGHLINATAWGGVNGHRDLPTGGQLTSPAADTRSPHWRTAEIPRAETQTSGFTPFPAAASASRREPMSVGMTWAWWSRRSTAGVARTLGMMVSKPEGCRLLVTATLRFS